MWPFKKSPIQLMKEKEDQRFIEALNCMAVEVTPSGRLINHGLSVYGAHKLYESRKIPTPTQWRVLLDNGEFMPYYDWVELNYPDCCKTCHDSGAVGNMFNSQPCPECSK